MRALAAGVDHAFRPDDVSLLDEAAIDFTRLHGHHQITYAYLPGRSGHQKTLPGPGDAAACASRSAGDGAGDEAVGLGAHRRRRRWRGGCWRRARAPAQHSQRPWAAGSGAPQPRGRKGNFSQNPPCQGPGRA